ncbi:unnamed protein product [Linum trigynum]|uniref:Uncharacterized protein n=1 Tax=Linum trigynum TaxID=586398 RepID=A0AAV2E0R6_9ROSI
MRRERHLGIGLCMSFHPEIAKQSPKKQSDYYDRKEQQNLQNLVQSVDTGSSLRKGSMAHGVGRRRKRRS